MIPIKITLSGFMSYREAQTLDFSDDPLWVLVGKNASGKSSIFDDESVFVDLALLPSAITRIPFCVSIHDAEIRQQNFGMVRKAYIRVVDAETKRELTRYDLSEEARSETVMIFGELYRNSNGWEFRAVGQSYKGSFAALVQSFGVEVAS